MSERRIDHRHRPVFHVVRAGWSDPLDASFSRSRADRRWNTAAFAALYCCCSVGVARAVALDVFRTGGIELEDLQPGLRPQLVEIGWGGQVVDVVSAAGVRSAGFPDDYPRGVARGTTRAAAERWHGTAAEGVCARSASLGRLGVTGWSGDHETYGELAVYVGNAVSPPELLRRRDDEGWLRAEPPS